MGKVLVYDHRLGDTRWVDIGGELPPEGVKVRQAKDPDADPDVVHEPQEVERSGLLPKNINDLRPAMVAGAAMVGGVLGTPAGPPGIAAGGAGGAMMGSLAHDLATDVGRRTGLVGPEGILEDDPRHGAVGGPLGPTKRALEEAAVDLVFPAGVGALRRTGLAAVRGISGLGKREVRESALRVAQYGEDLGVPLGLENVSEKGFVRGVRTILGKMPFFSRPFKRADIAQGDALLSAQENLISDISPIVSTVTDTGVDMSRSALRRATAMRGWFKKQYDSFIGDAEAAGARIPAENLRQRARDLVEEFGESLPRKITKEGAKPIRPPKGEDANEVIAWAREELINLADDMSPAQYRRLARSLNQLMVSNSDDPAAAGLAAALRRGLELDLENIVGPKELVKRIRDLNGAFGAWADVLNSPTGRRIGQSTRGVLGRLDFKRSLTTQEDTLFKAAFNTNSPQALGDLQRLIGPRSFASATRRHIENVFEAGLKGTEAAGKEQVISLTTVRSMLGIGKAGSPRRDAFEAMLRLSGGKTKFADWEKFFDVADAALGQKSVNVAQFLARRVVMAGGRRGLRVLNPANLFGNATAASGAAAGGYATSMFFGGGITNTALGLMGAFALRRGTQKLLTDPRTLRAATAMIDPTMIPAVRAQASARFVRLMGQDQMREMSDAFTQFAREKTGQAQIELNETLEDLKSVTPR